MSISLRVLTGAHAGAHLQLRAGDWSISSDRSATVRITDWSVGPLSLHVDADHAIHVRNDTSRAPHTEDSPWSAFTPRRFGDVILCVGPTSGPWPADPELLERLLATPAKPPAQPSEAVPQLRTQRRGSWMAITALVLLTPCALLLASTRDAAHAPNRTASAAPLPSLEQQVRVRLAPYSVDGLVIDRHDGDVVVRGVVRTGQEADTIRRELRNLSPRVRTSITTAPNVVENLRESIHEPGIAIAYLGDARFKISGGAQDPDRVRTLAERVRGDLDADVREIVVDVSQARRNAVRSDANSALSVDELTYVENPDGTKDFLAVHR